MMGYYVYLLRRLQLDLGVKAGSEFDEKCGEVGDYFSRFPDTKRDWEMHHTRWVDFRTYLGTLRSASLFVIQYLINLCRPVLFGPFGTNVRYMYHY